MGTTSRVPSVPFLPSKDTAASILARYDDAWWSCAGDTDERPPSFKRLGRDDDVTTWPHVVAHSALGGVPYSLFLFRIEGKDYSLLIDRKRSFYQVPVAAQSCFFNGSLFHGEIVWSENTKSQIFLVLDVICIKGDAGKVGRELLPRRLEVVRQTFDLYDEEVIGSAAAHACASQGKIVCGGNAFGLTFYPKPCFSLTMLPTLCRKALGGVASRGFLILPEAATAVECFQSGRHQEWQPTVNIEVNAAERTARLRRGAPLPGATCFELDNKFWIELRAALVGDDSPVHMVARCWVKAGEPLSFAALLRDRHEGDTESEAEACVCAAAGSSVGHLVGLEEHIRRR